uniref:Uncharacterized protein n=1 Tax=Timema tahoe TaxID=61484 RepID=A0A7R9ISV7_9NEOP|nr:unnamed protein product [Timema tahoe]
MLSSCLSSLFQGDTQRVIRHFHFTTWPDFGVPSPPQTLVRFVRAFRERVGPEQRPIVVHCSAGVGRSGTFITLDRILQQLNLSDKVDIFGIVWAMRKERSWMVQTEQQYICIHQCLLAVLEGNENQGPQREIHDNQGFEGKDPGLEVSVGATNPCEKNSTWRFLAPAWVQVVPGANFPVFIKHLALLGTSLGMSGPKCQLIFSCVPEVFS